MCTALKIHVYGKNFVFQFRGKEEGSLLFIPNIVLYTEWRVMDGWSEFILKLKIN